MKFKSAICVFFFLLFCHKLLLKKIVNIKYLLWFAPYNTYTHKNVAFSSSSFSRSINVMFLWLCWPFQSNIKLVEHQFVIFTSIIMVIFIIIISLQLLFVETQWKQYYYYYLDGWSGIKSNWFLILTSWSKFKLVLFNVFCTR